MAFVGDYADLHVIYYLTITETKKRKREKKKECCFLFSGSPPIKKRDIFRSRLILNSLPWLMTEVGSLPF